MARAAGSQFPNFLGGGFRFLPANPARGQRLYQSQPQLRLFLRGDAMPGAATRDEMRTGLRFDEAQGAAVKLVEGRTMTNGDDRRPR